MIKIEGIVVFDNSPTPAGEDLMRMCHEGMDMGCWHEWLPVIVDPTVKEPELPCKHCNARRKWEFTWTFDAGNPSYLTSLDAWLAVWEKMRDGQARQNREYGNALCAVYDKCDDIRGFIWESHPHHHLQALASVLTVECKQIPHSVYCCPQKEIDWMNQCRCCDDDNPHVACTCTDKPIKQCEDCHGKGTRTVLEVWRDKWQTEVKGG
jgi:hypothetical protein